MDKLAQITTFVRVVEHGGFSAAARDLQVAPPIDGIDAVPRANRAAPPRGRRAGVEATGG